jgi:hypothetical protein
MTLRATVEVFDRASTRYVSESESESESYVTTDGQSASCLVIKRSSWDYYQIFVTVRQLRVC